MPEVSGHFLFPETKYVDTPTLSMWKIKPTFALYFKVYLMGQTPVKKIALRFLSENEIHLKILKIVTNFA